MNDNPTLNRRQFLRTTGQAAGALTAASTFVPAVLYAASPGKTVGVGCIGLGTRGGDLMDAVVHAANVKVVAVCDVYGPHRQKGIQRSLNPEVKAYVDYRELLADPKVDAVVIATPDHWHCQIRGRGRNRGDPVAARVRGIEEIGGQPDGQRSGRLVPRVRPEETRLTTSAM